MKSSKKTLTELEQFVTNLFLANEDDEEDSVWEVRWKRRKELLSHLTDPVGTEFKVNEVSFSLVDRQCEFPWEYCTYCTVVLKVQTSELNGFIKLVGDANSWQDQSLGEAFYCEGFKEVKPKTVTAIVFEELS